MASAALVGMCKQVAQLVQTQQALLSTAAGEFLERKGRFDEETVRNKRKAGVHAGVDVRVKKVKRVTAATQDGKKASE
jgi:hypothetical protein